MLMGDKNDDDIVATQFILLLIIYVCRVETILDTKMSTGAVRYHGDFICRFLKNT